MKKDIKNIKYFTFGLFLSISLFLVSCNKEKESEGIGKVTTFVKLDLTGGEIYSHTISTPYTEPGYKATDIDAGNKDVTGSVVVEGSVDPDVAGVYPVTYTVYNSLGYKTEITRSVVVFDNSSVSSIDIAGAYDSKIFRTNTTSGASGTRPAKETEFYNITITKITEGLFAIDDFLGGWYWIGSSYGSGAAYSGLFVLKADNSIALVSADMDKGWEDGIVLDPDAKYDPATKTITFSSYMGSTLFLKFGVTLVKKEE